MRVYVATFHGDLEGEGPLVGESLEEVLNEMVEIYDFGRVEVHTETYRGRTETWQEVVTPDIEDDKIEVWEFDTQEKIARIVWGFWGWHWQMPEGMQQGKMPGHNKSLYDLAAEE